MNKKKLLVFHPALAPYRVDFFNSLNEHFDTVFYFNNTNVLDQKFDQEALKQQLHFEPKYLLRGINLKSRSIRIDIFKTINSEHPEIVLCSEYGQITLITFLYRFFTGKNYKIYTMSDDSLDNAEGRRGLRSYFRNFILNNIEGVILPSGEVCEWHKKQISKSLKTLELPIVHDDCIFRKKLAKSLNIVSDNIKTYDLKDKKVILFVGRLVEVKNLEFLLEAVSKLNSNDWKLIVVGSGDLEKKLKIISAELNIDLRVIFTGRKEGLELLSWYTTAHIFVLPSIYEPFGAVVNEALLGGCYVLCSELAGASSLIDSTNGQTFDPRKIEDLVEKLNHSLHNVKITDSNTAELRNNKMNFSFKEKIEPLINSI